MTKPTDLQVVVSCACALERLRLFASDTCEKLIAPKAEKDIMGDVLATTNAAIEALGHGNLPAVYAQALELRKLAAQSVYGDGYLVGPTAALVAELEPFAKAAVNLPGFPGPTVTF